MRPVLPVDVLDVDETQEGFVDQFGRLHAVVRTLAMQAPAGDAPQLGVDERHQRIQSRLVSLAPGSEEHRDLVGRAQHGCILTGFRVVSVSAVSFRLWGRRRYVDANDRLIAMTIGAVLGIGRLEPARELAIADPSRTRS